jgi:hypothetical protein
MEQFTDIVEGLLDKTSDKVKKTAQTIKTQELMSKLTTWMNVLWKSTYTNSDWTDALGREIKYGDVVAMIDWENWDCSFGIVIDEPDDTCKCRVFQMGAEEWEKEDPFYDCIYATPKADKLLILARKEDGEKMIRLLLNVKKK